MNDISLLIHTRNSADGLRRLLPTVDWCDDIVVVDMSSVDGTADVARTAGARVQTIDPEPWNDAIRNRYLGLVRHGWTLVLDSDEYLAADAGPALREAVGIASDRIDAYALPRVNIVAGQVLMGPRWYPDLQIRLFRSGCPRWTARHHQNPVGADGPLRVSPLPAGDQVRIHHASYATVAEFVERQVRYALTDRYDTGHLDLSANLADAFAILSDPDVEVDGSLGNALAVVLAWDRIVRGVLQWEAMDPRPDLPPFYGWPTIAIAADPNVRRRLSSAPSSYREAYEAVIASTSWRVTAPLRAISDRRKARRSRAMSRGVPDR